MLKDLYETPGNAGSYNSALKLRHAALKEKGLKIPLKIIQKWLKSVETYTRFRPRRKVFKRNPIIVTEIDEQWQGDLAEMGDLAKWNGGVRYLLICVDVMRRYGYVEGLKNKGKEEVTQGFEKILKRSKGHVPKKLQTDDGKEFLNDRFQAMLKKNDIAFFTLKSETKAAVAERLVRTIKEKLWRYMDRHLTRKYIDVLQDVMHSYNKTYHKSIKMAPEEVNDARLAEVVENLYGYLWVDQDRRKMKKKKQKKVSENLKIGDWVRLSLSKNIFEKGFRGNWTNELFKVKKVIYSKPYVSYVIEDYEGEEVKGKFYGMELQNVDHRGDDGKFWKVEKIIKSRKTPKGGREHFVKWLGYPEKFNSWVSVKDIKKG